MRAFSSSTLPVPNSVDGFGVRHRHDRAVGDLEIDRLGKADGFGETIVRRMH